MTRLSTWPARNLLLLSLALLACADAREGEDQAAPLAAQGDAGAASRADSSTLLGGGTSSPACRFTLWPSPEATTTDYFCWPSLSATQCLCAGTLVNVAGSDPKRCLQTIADVCKVDTSIRTYCEHGRGGSGAGCWPGSGDQQWLCTCELNGARQQVEADSCSAAGAKLCKQPEPASACEDATGRCKLTSDGQFDCECVQDAPAKHQLGAASCDAALATACARTSVPMAAKEECSTPLFMQNGSPAGRCSSKGRDPIDGFECQCNLPNQNPRQGKVMADACDKALLYFCPEAVVK